MNILVANSRFDRPGINGNIRYRYEQELAGLEVPFLLQYKAELTEGKQWVLGSGINFVRRSNISVNNHYEVFHHTYSIYHPTSVQTSYRHNQTHWDADLLFNLGYQNRPINGMGYEVGINYQIGLGLLPYIEIENSYQVEQQYGHGSITESFRSQIQPSLRYFEFYLRLYPSFLQYRKD